MAEVNAKMLAEDGERDPTVLADRIGASATIAAGGAACLACGIWFRSKLPLLRRLVRPIYVERGILPVPVVVDTGQKAL